MGARHTVDKTDFLGQIQLLDDENKGATAGDKSDFSRYVGSLGVHYCFSDRTMGYAIASYAKGIGQIESELTYAHIGLTHFF